MLESYLWPENYLLVNIQAGRDGGWGVLLDHCSQEQFFEHWCSTYGHRITGINITILSEESFEILTKLYPKGAIVEGD